MSWHQTGEPMTGCVNTHHSSVRYISASEQYAVEISVGVAQGLELLAAAP